MEDVKRLSAPQLRKIWVSARELGWDDQRLHQELERVIGVTSLRDLSRRNAKLFIDYLVSEGATSGRHRARSCLVDGPRREPCPPNVIELATPAQQQYIDGLLQGLKWNRQIDYFLGCLKKATGRTTIRTRREASMAITILQKLSERILNQAPGTTAGNGNEASGP
jgi:hypothetical protein